VFENYFTPEKFVLFRVAARIFSLNSFFAYWFKYLIRKKMITANHFSQHTYQRDIQLGVDEVTVVDRVDQLRHNEKFYWGGAFQTRYVPQSAYFQTADLHSGPCSIPITRYGSVTIRQKITCDGGAEGVCVE